MKKIGRAVLGSFGHFLGNAGGTVSFDTLDAWSSLEAAIKHLAKKEDYEVFYWEQSKTMRRKGEVLQRLLEFDDEIVRSDISIHCECDINSKKKRLYLRVDWAQWVNSPLEQYCIDHDIKNWAGDYSYMFKLAEPSSVKNVGLKYRDAGPFEIVAAIEEWFGSAGLKRNMKFLKGAVEK